MIKKIIQQIKNFSEQNIDNAKIFVGDSHYVGLKIDKNNFHEISKNKIGRAIFVDGGNAELFNNHSLSVQFLRVYSAEYNNDKKVDFVKEDYYLLSTASIKNNRLFYEVETFPERIKFSIDAMDSNIRSGLNRAPLSKMGDIARRFLELDLAKRVMKENSLIVLDGSLKPNYPGEVNYIKNLINEAKNKNSNVCALSKTTNLITDKNLPVTSILRKIQVLKKWSYYPAIINNNEDHDAEIFFVKLNKNSDYIFRLDIAKEFLNNKESIISTLSFYSNDFSFPGYPYGLIDADRFARISESEHNILSLRLKHSLQNVVSDLNTNAHELLNNLINR